MIVYERAGDYVPSAVADQLRDAGIDCQGVTSTEDAAGNVAAIQIVCGDDTTEKQLDKALSKYAAPDLAAADREAKQAQIEAALAATDKWAARAYEDGIDMPADRKQYRQQLRDLHQQAAKATTADAIQKLEIPDPPTGKG